MIQIPCIIYGWKPDLISFCFSLTKQRNCKIADVAVSVNDTVILKRCESEPWRPCGRTEKIIRLLGKVLFKWNDENDYQKKNRGYPYHSNAEVGKNTCVNLKRFSSHSFSDGTEYYRWKI